MNLFIKEGLSRQERCIYAAPDHAVSKTAATLAEIGVDIAVEQRRGGFKFLNQRATFLPSGRFEPGAVIDLLSRAQAEALADGYSGLRFIGEMSWTSDRRVASSQVIEYEARLNGFLAESRACALCDYDLPEKIDDALRTHPLVSLGQTTRANPFYEPADLVLGDTDEPIEGFKRRRGAWRIGRIAAARAADESRARGQHAGRGVRDALEETARTLAMGQLAASISHEIKQPLVGVVTNADAALHWLKHDPPNLDEARDNLNRIARDGRHAAAMLDPIRLRLAGPQDERVRLDANAIVREVLAAVGPELSDHQIVVTSRLATPSPRIQGDLVQIEQAVFNLILNAIEAMARAPEGARELTVSTLADDAHHVRIAVGDTGPGFAPADAERLFDAFYSTKPGGLGLGLSICRTIAESHDGQLSAALGEARGAVFGLRLPSAPGARG